MCDAFYQDALSGEGLGRVFYLSFALEDIGAVAVVMVAVKPHFFPSNCFYESCFFSQETQVNPCSSLAGLWVSRVG